MFLPGQKELNKKLLVEILKYELCQHVLSWNVYCVRTKQTYFDEKANVSMVLTCKVRVARLWTMHRFYKLNVFEYALTRLYTLPMSCSDCLVKICLGKH